MPGSGQWYVELAQDVFNPVANQLDWLELIDSGPSPSNTHLSNDAQEATLVGYIPWNKQRSAATWFLGFAYADANYIMHRNNPEAHPIFPWLYASEISFTPFNPLPYYISSTNTGPQTLRWQTPWYGSSDVQLEVASHKLAVTTVKFRSFRNSFVDDSEITDSRMEWMRNVYIDLEPRLEALSADGVGQLAFVGTSERVAGPPTVPAGPTITPGTQVPFPAPIAELLGKNNFVISWLNVPFEYLSAEEDYFYPTNILSCLGRVNSDNFPYNSSDPFLPGQLMFEGVKFVQKVFPIAAANPAIPLISVDVSMSLTYFNPPTPPQGASILGNLTDYLNNPLTGYYGWNLMPWRQNGLWYPANRVDPGTSPGAATLNTPGFLTSAPFNNMFVSPN